MALFNAKLAQKRGKEEIDRLLKDKDKEARNSIAPTIRLRHGVLVGKMEIPRLNVSAVVFEGTDEPILSKGVGHLTGSALPGQRGNVVLAGHRDSFFLALRNIRS